MPSDERTPPVGRMVLSVLFGLFFAAFAFGSFHTSRQNYRWRNATVVRGVLVKNGSRFHYEYRPPGGPAVTGPDLSDETSGKPDGIVDDSVRLEYDPSLPGKLRRHWTKGRVESNYGHAVITGTVAAFFFAAVLGCLWAFLRAWHDKRQAES